MSSCKSSLFENTIISSEYIVLSNEEVQSNYCHLEFKIEKEYQDIRLRKEIILLSSFSATQLKRITSRSSWSLILLKRSGKCTHKPLAIEAFQHISVLKCKNLLDFRTHHVGNSLYCSSGYRMCDRNEIFVIGDRNDFLSQFSALISQLAT